MAVCRETGEPRVWGPYCHTFEGNSAFRKRSRDWYACGHWSNIDAIWGPRRALESSPFYMNIKTVIANTKEEAIDEFSKA